MKQFAFILISTFVVGFATGVYAYFVTRSPNDTTPSYLRERAGGFQIAVDAYGGCEQSGCPSYQLTDDGSYIYIPSRSDPSSPRVTNAIAADELASIKTQINHTDFATLASSTFTGACSATLGKDAYRYSFHFNDSNETYTFDSCKQRVSTVTLFGTLEGLFTEFAARATHS